MCLECIKAQWLLWMSSSIYKAKKNKKKIQLILNAIILYAIKGNISFIPYLWTVCSSSALKMKYSVFLWYSLKCNLSVGSSFNINPKRGWLSKAATSCRRQHRTDVPLTRNRFHLCSVITWQWTSTETNRRPYLTCSICVQDFVFDDKPQSLPLLLIALWPL